MRPTVSDKVKERLAVLDDLGTVDESAYALPLKNPDSDMTWVQLKSQQEREIQSGRWQVMQARHWFQMTLQAETEEEANRLFDKANGFYWEAMYHAKHKLARLTVLPAKGGRPKSEDIDILIEEVDAVRSERPTLIATIRHVLSQNLHLKMRYGDKSDDYLRKIIRERRKEKNRP